MLNLMWVKKLLILKGLSMFIVHAWKKLIALFSTNNNHALGLKKDGSKTTFGVEEKPSG